MISVTTVIYFIIQPLTGYRPSVCSEHRDVDFKATVSNFFLPCLVSQGQCFLTSEANMANSQTTSEANMADSQTTSVCIFTQFEKLDGASDYITWKFIIKMQLIKEGLWNCIDNPSDTLVPAKDQKSLALLR